MTAAFKSLDGEWLLATDPKNIGRDEKWWERPAAGAKAAKVPWIIQEVFPGYHGLAWYWREFVLPDHPQHSGRHLLRFWAVDYQAHVWLNDVHVGAHEGGETPFVLDVTEAIRPGATNRLAVRVLNPTHERIDGIVLDETPRRCRVMPYKAGWAYNHGGIVDSVELLAVPSVHIEDLFCRPDPKTGGLSIEVTVRNAAKNPFRGRLAFSVAPAAGGRPLDECEVESGLPPGQTRVVATLKVASPRIWDLNDPFLYRVTASMRTDQAEAVDEFSTRCGFRDFHFSHGYFRLNGRRVFLRSGHTCNQFPLGLQFPHDPDLARRDLLNIKVMGFNMVRFIWGGATRAQLDLCDEIGLLVYAESYASFPMADSPQMTGRFDRAVSELIRRDRNHPSIVIWGLLNEAPDGAAFNHAVASLPAVRALDDSRVVMLNSGRMDGRLNIGSLCNPGKTAWEHLLGREAPDAPLTKTEAFAYFTGAGDAHAYPTVPHTAAIIQFLRTVGHGSKPILLSEYGIGSAADLWRTVRHYEQLGKEALEDAQFYRDKLDRFLADWKDWRLDECFDRPEDFFRQSLRKMAGQRTLGLNAVRSNPNMAGYNLTGLIDHVMTGEGLTTPFREFKPGTMDALAEGWAPLRLCLFVEPVNIYRATSVKLEAVLANEDALRPGAYPVRLCVVGPHGVHLLDRTVTIHVPEIKIDAEPPLALPVFSAEILIDGPSGRYRFLAALEKGGAATGGETEFYVADPAEMTKVETDIALCGDDEELTRWLSARAIRVHPFEPGSPTASEVILVATKTAASGGAKLLPELARRIETGATVVFLSPEIFKDAPPEGAAPFRDAGEFTPFHSWLYLKDEWAKHHPIFAGLPAGGLMDTTFYREIIPDILLVPKNPPAEAVAGAIKASQDYSSGLMVSVHRHGQGHFILNTLLIRENLGQHPAAEQLLRNLLNYAARLAHQARRS